MKCTTNKRLKKGTFVIEGRMNNNLDPGTSMSGFNSWNRSKGSSSLRWQGIPWVWNLPGFVPTMLRKECASNREAFFQLKCVMCQFINDMLLHFCVGKAMSEAPSLSEVAVVELAATIVCYCHWLVLGSTAALDSRGCTSEIEALS